MFWNSISIKKLKDDDCDFFKKFHERYCSIMIPSQLNASNFVSLSDDDLASLTDLIENEAIHEMKKINWGLLTMGIDVTNPVFSEERELPINSVQKKVFPTYSMKETYLLFLNFEEFLSIFSTVEKILKELLEENNIKTKVSAEIPANLLDFLKQKGLTSKFFSNLGNKTFIKNEKSFCSFWNLSRTIRNILGHSYGNISEKNITQVNSSINNFLCELQTSLDDQTFLIITGLLDDNTLLNSFEGPSNDKDIINRPVLEKDKFLHLDPIFSSFTRNFFVYFMESLNDTLISTL